MKILISKPHKCLVRRIFPRQRSVTIRTMLQLLLTSPWSMQQVLKLFRPFKCHVEKNIHLCCRSRICMLKITLRSASLFGSILWHWLSMIFTTSMRVIDACWVILQPSGSDRAAFTISVLVWIAIQPIVAARSVQLQFLSFAKRLYVSSSVYARRYFVQWMNRCLYIELLMKFVIVP